MQINPLTIQGDIPTVAQFEQSSVQHRDEVIALAKGALKVETQAELETAVHILKDLAAITKETESARKTVKAPVIELGKKIDEVASDFIGPVEREKNRLTGLVNHFQRKQLEEQQERERKAREEQRQAELAAQKAADDARKAQEAIDKAKTDKARKEAQEKLLAAQLKQEDAAQDAQNASAQLAVPTNTPRGMVTKTRYDFEITKPFAFVACAPQYFIWHSKDEVLKIDRAGLLKALNNEAEPHKWLPKEGGSVLHDDLGVRIFRDISVSVRG